MKAIRYSVHFPALIVAALVIWLTEGVDLPARIVNFRIVHFGIPGALYAISIVVSLRNRKAIRPSTALGFIALAALWSAATPIAGLWGSIVWFPTTVFLPPSLNNLIFALITGSAIGALGYWVLVRWFWIRSLRRMDLLRTVTLCVSATLLADGYGYAIPSGFSLTWPGFEGRLFDLLFTIAWWFAFSISLYWSESSIAPRKMSIVLGMATVILVLGGMAFTLRQMDAYVKDDRARLSDLKSIAGALHVDWEYAQDKNLTWQAPSTLKDFPKPLHGTHIADPITGVPYDYRPVSGSNYQLCAVFDHDSTRQAGEFTKNGWSFAKGLNCFAVDASTSPY